MPRISALVIAAAALLAGCGSSVPTSSASVIADATITSGPLDFDSPTLVAPGDRPWTLHFTNTSLMPHNVAIYTDASAVELIFRGETIEQRDTVYAVPALAAGTYFFRCDLHPDMKGTVVAGEPVSSD